MIRETLCSVTHTNAAGMCQAADTGQCPDNMSHTVEPDEQDIEIISGDTRYWENWESEVQYNSGRSNIREVSPQLPSKTSNQPSNQISSAEQENNYGSPIVEHNNEYIEEDCKNPLTEEKGMCVPLDLTVKSGEQPAPSDASTNTSEGQTGHKDESHLVTDEYLKSEIEKIKEQVIQDLMIFTAEKE